MSAFACPRCATQVVGDPANLVCPSCGFTSRRAAAPYAMPATPYVHTPAPGASPAPASVAWPAPADAPAYGAPALPGPAGVPLSNAGVARPMPPRRATGFAVTGAALVVAAAALRFVLSVVRLNADLPTWLAPVLFLGLAATVTGVVLFCIGLYRLVDNVRRAQPGAGIRPGWGIGSLFIPFVQFFAPYPTIGKAVQADGGPVRLLALWFFPFVTALVAALGVFFVAISIGVSAGVDCAKKYPDGGFAQDACLQSRVADLDERFAPFQAVSEFLWLVAGIALLCFLYSWCKHQDNRTAAKTGAGPWG